MLTWGAAIAQSASRLSTGWTVRGSKPGVEARFSSPVQTGPWAHPTSYKIGTVSFPGVKRPGRCVEHPPLIWRRGWRKSTAIHLLPLRAFVACYRVTFTFTLSTWYVVSPSINPQAERPHLVGCPVLFMQYIPSCPSSLQAVSSGRPTPRWRWSNMEL